MTINDIREHIENDKTRNRSAWDRGVTAYAMDLLDQLQESVDYGDADLSRILEPCTAPGCRTGSSASATATTL